MCIRDRCGPPWIFPGCDDRYMGNSGRGQIRDGEESYWTQPLYHCGAGRFDAGIGPVRKLKGVEGRRTRAGAYADGLGIKAVRDTDQVFDRGKACLGVTAPKVGRLLGIARIRHPHVEAVRVVSASAEGTGAAGTSDIDNDRIFGTDTAAFAVFAMEDVYKRQGIRNKVYVWGFIVLCLVLLIYLYIDNIISAVSEFHLSDLPFSLFEQITFLISLCCTIMVFVLCKKGAFFGYSNGLLIVGSIVLFPLGITDITHLITFEIFNIPAYCSDLQFQILNIAINAVLPVTLIIIMFFLLNRIYIHNR